MSDFNVGMNLKARDGISPVLKRASKAVTDTGQKVNRFSRACGYAYKGTGRFNNRILQSVGAFGRFNRGARQAGRVLDLFTRKQKQATEATSRFRKVAMGAFAGAAIAMGGGALMGSMGGALGTAMDYQASIDKVAAVANIKKGSSDYNMLDSQAKDLGATTWASSSQAASGQQSLAMAGFKPDEIKKAMPSMLDLAKGGDLDLGTTADITSNVLSGYGMKAKETGRLADVMAATITTSNTNLSMLGDTMKYVAPIAAKMNGTIEEGAAMAGMLGNVGIQGSMAGTTMRAMYSRMASPPKMAQNAMAEIGLSITDANGQLKSMPTLLKEVHKRTAGMSKDKRMDVFKKLAGQEAMAGFAELVSQAGSGALDTYIKELEGSTGRARALSKQMSDNLKGDLTSMGSAVEAIKISAGEQLLPNARGTVQSLTKIMRHVNFLVKTNPKATKTILMMAGALAAVGVAAGGMMLLAPILMAVLSPIGLAVGGLTAGAAAIAANWGSLSNDVRSTFKSFKRVFIFMGQDIAKITSSFFRGDWAGVKEGFDSLKFYLGRLPIYFKEAFGHATFALDSLFGFDQGTILSKVTPVFRAMGQFITGFKQGFGESFGVIAEVANGLWWGLSKIAGVLGQITGMFGNITEGSRVFEHFGRVVGWAAAAFVPFFAIKAVIGATASAIGVFGWALSAAASLLAPLSVALGAVKWAVLGLGRALLMNPIGLTIAAIAGGAYLIMNNWGGISAWFSNLWESIKNNISQKWQAIKGLFNWDIKGVISAIWGGISAMFTGYVNLWKSLLSLGFKGIKTIFGWSPIDTIKEKWAGISDTVLEPVRKAQEKLSSAWASLSGIFGRNDKKGKKGQIEMTAIMPDTAILEAKKLIVSDIQAGLQQIPGLTNNVNTALQSMKGVLKAESWQHEGQRLMETLAAGIKAGTNSAVNAVAGATAKMDALLPHSDAKTGALSRLTASGAALMPTFASGIKQTAYAPVKAMQPALSAVGNQLQPVSPTAMAYSAFNQPQNSSQDIQVTVNLTQNIHGGTDAGEIAKQAAMQTREAFNGALTDIGDL